MRITRRHLLGELLSQRALLRRQLDYAVFRDASVSDVNSLLSQINSKDSLIRRVALSALADALTWALPGMLLALGLGSVVRVPSVRVTIDATASAVTVLSGAGKDVIGSSMFIGRPDLAAPYGSSLRENLVAVKDLSLDPRTLFNLKVTKPGCARLEIKAGGLTLTLLDADRSASTERRILASEDIELCANNLQLTLLKPGSLSIQDAYGPRNSAVALPSIIEGTARYPSMGDESRALAPASILESNDLQSATVVLRVEKAIRVYADVRITQGFEGSAAKSSYLVPTILHWIWGSTEIKAVLSIIAGAVGLIVKFKKFAST